MRFIKPSLEYIDSYLEAQDYLQKEGLTTFRITCEEVKKDKLKFISEFKILETEKCIEIVSSFVPSTVYWLIDEKRKKVIGILNIRHRLNEYLISNGGHIGYCVSPNYRNKGYGGKLLDKGLEIAKELGLGEILITCNSDNIGSKKIIESRKGILINDFSEKESIKLRYRIIINNSAQKMWRNFLKTATDSNLKKNEFNYTCFQFGMSPNQLGALVLLGIKKATASLVFFYENESARYPQVGDFNIVLNSDNEAICIIKISDTKKMKFCDVDEKFAKLEGEGDKTLFHWKKVHKEFFQEELTKYRKKFTEDMEVFLEKFEVIYK